MKVKEFFLTSVCVLNLGTGLSAQGVAGSGVDAKQINKNEITRTEVLTDAITHAVEFRGREGIAFISQNGRYVLRGRIFDMWTGEEIDTLDAVVQSRQTTSLEALNLKDEDVDPFYWGEGAKEVTIFVDPLCPYCKQVMTELVADPTYRQNYKFKLFVVPYLGDPSVKAVNALSCAEDREAAIIALLTHDRDWMREHEKDALGCDVQPVLNRTLMAQMVGVSGVPYLIATEGGISRGAPADLRRFLAEN